MMKTFVNKMRLYYPLIKSPQTALLVLTGMAGYLTVRCPVYNLGTLAGLLVSLLASISGSTILNMWWDRDIDAKMKRTQKRPTASGKIGSRETLAIGLVLSVLGVGLAFAMGVLYGAIIFAGLFFDVVVYTIWLKRRTCWSIVFGGVSGGMPILAGRALGLGSIDWVGIVLMLGVLFWIPTHIMTFNMRYFDDYQAARVPTFAAKYGFSFTRVMIAVSTLLTALSMGAAALGIGMDWGLMRLLAVESLGLMILAVFMIVHPTERINFGLFKYASIYMLSSMLLMAV
ncbi:MAG: UbiA family prenyltransferase [Anaerolineaceae bacterium]